MRKKVSMTDEDNPRSNLFKHEIIEMGLNISLLTDKYFGNKTQNSLFNKANCKSIQLLQQCVSHHALFASSLN